MVKTHIYVIVGKERISVYVCKRERKIEIKKENNSPALASRDAVRKMPTHQSICEKSNQTVNCIIV